MSQALGNIVGAWGCVMRRFAVTVALVAVCALVFAAVRPATADILVNVSKTSQRMAVMVDGSARYNWLISTGRGRYVTPNGVFQPTWMARKWRSRQYKGAPMPYSIFFNRGYAIHGTTEISRLGRVASHGCVRLHPKDAAVLFALVKDQMADTRVVVSNDAIEAPGPVQPPKKPSQAVAQAIDVEPTSLEPAAVSVAKKSSAPESLAMTEKPLAAAERLLAEKPVATGKRNGRHDVAKAPARPPHIASRETVKAPAPLAATRTVARLDPNPGFRW